MRKAVWLLLLMLTDKLVFAQELRTDISVHGPVMIKQDNVYYLFCTEQGMWPSVDMIP